VAANVGHRNWLNKAETNVYNQWYK